MKEYLITNKGCQTLLAWLHKGPYPMPQGNDIRYRNRLLTNLHAENLDYLLDQGIVDFPIKAEIIDDKQLKVIDERIPKEFLFDQRIIKNCTEVYRSPMNENGEVLLGYKSVVHDNPGYVYAPYIPNIGQAKIKVS